MTTTAQITGGSVEFTRPSSYSTDKSGAKVFLTFSCAEGTSDEDAAAMLDKVAGMAVAKAHDIVGEKVPGAGSVNGSTSGNALSGGSTPPPPPSPKADPTPPAAPVQPDTLGQPTLTAQIGPGVTIGASPSEITDQQLKEAIEHKVAKLVTDAGNDSVARQAGPVAVGKLIAEYVPPPQKMYSVTSQEKRAEFLVRLDALKPLGVPAPGLI